MVDLMDDASMRVRHTFHPYDFSPASPTSFGQALKLSLGIRRDDR